MSKVISCDPHGRNRTFSLAFIRRPLLPLSHIREESAHAIVDPRSRLRNGFSRAGGIRTLTLRFKRPLCCRYTTTRMYMVGQRFQRLENHGSFPLNEWLRVVDSGSLKDRT